MFINQLLTWWLIVFISKATLAALQLVLNKALESIGSAVLTPFKEEPKLKLVMVMVIFPVILNSIQFWVQDNFLKLKKEVYPQLEIPQNNQLQYVLPENVNSDKLNDFKEGPSDNEIRIDFKEDKEMEDKNHDNSHNIKITTHSNSNNHNNSNMEVNQEELVNNIKHIQNALKSKNKK